MVVNVKCFWKRMIVTIQEGPERSERFTRKKKELK